MNSLVPIAYPQPGEVIDGKYRIDRVLGEGGMGAVARATHMVLRAHVALKFMNPQFMSFPGAVDRFLNEGIASKAIKSEHVVQVDDVGKLPNGAPYLVMDCLDGLDLSQLLERDGRPGLETERSLHFVVQILRGLQVAHATGIVHRDMKPSNCFVVTQDGEADFVKILDFGISKVTQPGQASLTQTNSALGTPLYMSPEQAKSPRDVDSRSDLYSVGVILYELLTGQTPFMSETGEFTEILFKLFTAEVPPIRDKRPDLAEPLAEVIHKCLAREPANRWSSALEAASALEPFCGARAKRLVEKMKAYVPPATTSLAPPTANMPGSMVAFSALGAGAGAITGAQELPAPNTRAHGTPSAVSPYVAAAVAAAPTQHAPPGSAPPRPAHAPPAHAVPRTRVSGTRSDAPPGAPAHAVARPAAAGDPLVARSEPLAGPAPRRSPLVFVLPVALAAVVVGGVALVLRLQGAHATGDGLTGGLTSPTTAPPPSASTAGTAAPSSTGAVATAAADAASPTPPEVSNLHPLPSSTPSTRPTGPATGGPSRPHPTNDPLKATIQH